MVSLVQFKDKTLRAIEDQTIVRPHRPYLGMSKLGHSCERYLWYSFRWCYVIELSPRQIRLFARGHLEEPRVVEALGTVGIECWGDQDEVQMISGHCKGHRDGVCLGVLEAPKTEHLLEIKTMNDKYFKQMFKQGVQVSKPVYYGQMQIYMRKFNLTRALFVAVNKNDDSLYIERVKLDKGFADDLERKAESIIMSEAPPEKRFNKTWYECKFCDARQICHNGQSPDRNCRTCKYVDLHNEGRWACQLKDDWLSTEEQRTGCKKYSINSFLL